MLKIITSKSRSFLFRYLPLMKGIKSFATDEQNRFTVAVEGNIGSGKTTLLQYFSKIPDVEVYQEPVDRWRNVNGHNLLNLMYQDPSRWSLTFQTYVQLTMLDIHTKSSAVSVKMIERSIYSAKYCFVENLFKSGKMPDAEYVVLTEWFNWLVSHANIHIDLIVYLKTKPEIVYERIKNRSREEEKCIPLSYLQALHTLHEDWLVHSSKFNIPAPVLILDGNLEKENLYNLLDAHKSDILCQRNAKTELIL